MLTDCGRFMWKHYGRLIYLSLSYAVEHPFQTFFNLSVKSIYSQSSSTEFFFHFISIFIFRDKFSVTEILYLIQIIYIFPKDE